MGRTSQHLTADLLVTVEALEKATNAEAKELKGLEVKSKARFNECMILRAEVKELSAEVEELKRGVEHWKALWLSCVPSEETQGD